LRRREFITGLGGAAAAWPVVARAQQPAMPVIGVLLTGAEPPPQLIAAFSRGLAETGYVEGRNVKIEYSRALPEYDRLRELAADLVRRRVTVIAAPGSTPAALAAKASGTTIPIVFSIGGDPVQLGLVAAFNRPGGNVTGFSEMATEVGPKRFGLLHQLVPKAERFAALVNPKNALAEFDIKESQSAAAAIGRAVEIFSAADDDELDAAFASFIAKRIDALLVTPDALFFQRRVQIAALAARLAMPAAYWDRAFPEAGGLMSYGSSVADSFRQVGIYTGRILKGERPGDLPVLQPTKFELVINLKTAKALGLTIPETLLAIADEVIQ
jgi:putative tryptophan/tyrosine transport system substrate-binding protein